MGQKEKLASFLERSGALTPLFALRQRVPPATLTVITYHSIGSVPADYPFDAEVIDATRESFEAQLETIRTHCSVIGIDELCEALRTGRLPCNAVMVTFDDGYKSCHDVALPLLERYGVKATFFIATDYVSERRMFWWDLVNYFLRTTALPVVSLSYPQAVSLDLRDRSLAISSALSLVKGTYGIDPRRFVEHLADACQLAFSREQERTFADQIIMTWDEVKNLRRAGMDVEAHTRTHRVLQTLGPQDLESELAGCRRDLEQALGGKVRSIAYPVGFPIDDRPDLLRAIFAAGYEVGFTNATGINWWLRKPHPLSVRRVATDRNESLALFKARLALPALA